MDINALFPSKYLKAEDLQGKTVSVSISHMKLEKMGVGDEKEDKAVLYFVGKQKGLILNKTNAMAISAAYTSETNNWRGKRVVLFTENVKSFGKWQEVIRVRVLQAEGAPAPATTPAVAQQAQQQVEDEDFYEGDDEPDDGDDLFSPAASPDGAAGGGDWDDSTPPRQNLAAVGKLVFGDDWPMAASWVIMRWTRAQNRDHVVDNEAALSEDQCDLLADYLKAETDYYRHVWPAQKATMLQSTN